MHRGHLQNVMVHEVGHALGLPHEHQQEHPQAGVVLCEPFASQLAGCRACANAANSCTITSYNNCVEANLAGPNPIVLNADDQKTRDEQISNLEPLAGDVALTVYDVRSVLNYCATPPSEVATRVVDDNDAAKTDWQLSEYDKMGIELLYPRSSPLKLACRGGCVRVGAGNVILRTNGSLRDEWQGRGALPWWVSSPTWKKGATVVGTGGSLSASRIGSGGTITFTGEDKWHTGAVITGTGAADVNNGRWTAVTMSAVQAALL
jgi:hypothetical protein